VRSTDASHVACDPALIEAIRIYWNAHIHDLSIARHPVGSAAFFAELDAYRFDKLRYLPQLIDFTAYRDRRLLEVGCGVGIDLLRFARGGAIVAGVDLSEIAIDLARANVAHHGYAADLQVMNGEDLRFADASFDAVYAHGVLQYTADAGRMVQELHRVLRPGGEAILMVYNRYSWLNLLAKLTGVALEHQDAPRFQTYSIGQFRQLLAPFRSVRIIPERFPVPTRLHHGVKARLYNTLFVGAFQRLPRALIRPLGWHLMAFVRK
jgi:SAM-dependent methyltransferase